jgi:quinol-cytochrome oxidoreductase complex cytochrome b subunit
LDLISKHKFLFIVLNVGILIATPLEASRLPLELQVIVGLISFVVLNFVAFVGVRFKAMKQGNTL